jgi:hypothetical protein
MYICKGPGNVACSWNKKLCAACAQLCSIFRLVYVMAVRALSLLCQIPHRQPACPSAGTASMPIDRYSQHAHLQVQPACQGTASMPICRYSQHAHLQVQPACPSEGTASMPIRRYIQNAISRYSQPVHLQVQPACPSASCLA